MNIPVMMAPENPSQGLRRKFNKVGLIDADFLKYMVCHKIAAHIKERGVHPSMDMGRHYLDKFVQTVLDNYIYSRFESVGNIFFFSGSSRDTFRHYVGFTKEYKGNRTMDTDTYPEYYMDLAKVMGRISKLEPVYIHPDYEADDLVAMLQNEHTFIYSRDKDLNQVEGLHYDERTSDLVQVDRSTAMYNLCMQLLTGDTVDNIPGVEGVGPKTAEKVLEDVADMHKLSRVVKSYINKYGTVEGYDRFCESWMLIKMRMGRPGFEREKLSRAFHMRDVLLQSINH